MSEEIEKAYGFAFTYKEVYDAFLDCLENKASTANAIKYTQNKLIDLVALCDEVNNRTYKIGPSIAFIVKYPVYREVFAADFRDRIIHHLVMRELMPYFEKAFLPESYSCRAEKGVLHGVDDMFKKIELCTKNYTKDAWILKMDVKSFFMSIRKALLAQVIDNFIVKNYPDNRKKEALRWLCRMIILHHPEKNCVRKCNIKLWEELPKGKSLFEVGDEFGLPIGNLTSQIFANFFMDVFDRFVRFTLGFEYYGRYVDDFMIISTDKAKLLKAIPLMEAFAKEELGLTIHKDKRYLQHYTKGVKFIGSVLKPNRKYVLNRTKGNFVEKLQTTFKHYSTENSTAFMMCVNSYLGFLGKYSTFNIRKEILTNKKLIGEWLPHINVAKGYKKITLKNNPEKIKVKRLIA